MDDVRSFEHNLTRSANLRIAENHATELDDILRHVASRRARRIGVDGDDIPRGAVALPSSAGPPRRVLSVEPVGSDVRIIRVGRPIDLQFRAGQYVKLGVPGGRSASYSLASAPHESHVEFCVERIPGGRLSPLLFALAPGDEVSLTSAAKGRFVLDDSACHLMIATVTGIAPLRSMLRDALHRGGTAEFVILHGASHQDELPYFDELQALAASDARVQYRATVTRPDAARNAGWALDVGRVDDLACRVASGLDPRRTRCYACGHPEMVKRVAGELGGSFVVSTEVFD